MYIVLIILVCVALYYYINHKGNAWNMFKLDMDSITFKWGNWLNKTFFKNKRKNVIVKKKSILSIDEILEKIKKNGMRSLSPEEKLKLNRYSKSLK